MIVVIGSINLDLIAKVDRLPTPGETVSGSLVDRISMRIGPRRHVDLRPRNMEKAERVRRRQCAGLVHINDIVRNSRHARRCLRDRSDRTKRTHNSHEPLILHWTLGDRRLSDCGGRTLAAARELDVLGHARA